MNRKDVLASALVLVAGVGPVADSQGDKRPKPKDSPRVVAFRGVEVSAVPAETKKGPVARISVKNPGRETRCVDLPLQIEVTPFAPMMRIDPFRGGKLRTEKVEVRAHEIRLLEIPLAETETTGGRETPVRFIVSLKISETEEAVLLAYAPPRESAEY